MKHLAKIKVEVTEGPGYYKATTFVGDLSASACHPLRDAAVGFAFELLGRKIVNAALVDVEAKR